MTTTYLLLMIVGLFVVGVLWRINRVVLGREPVHTPVDPDEADVLASERSAAERLRREAAATDDPEEKRTLTKLADEAEGDVDKLKTDLERNG